MAYDIQWSLAPKLLLLILGGATLGRTMMVEILMSFQVRFAGLVHNPTEWIDMNGLHHIESCNLKT